MSQKYKQTCSRPVIVSCKSVLLVLVTSFAPPVAVAADKWLFGYDALAAFGQTRIQELETSTDGRFEFNDTSDVQLYRLNLSGEYADDFTKVGLYIEIESADVSADDEIDPVRVNNLVGSIESWLNPNVGWFLGNVQGTIREDTVLEFSDLRSVREENTFVTGPRLKFTPTKNSTLDGRIFYLAESDDVGFNAQSVQSTLTWDINQDNDQYQLRLRNKVTELSAGERRNTSSASTSIGRRWSKLFFKTGLELVNVSVDSLTRNCIDASLRATYDFTSSLTFSVNAEQLLGQQTSCTFNLLVAREPDIRIAPTNNQLKNDTNIRARLQYASDKEFAIVAVKYTETSSPAATMQITDQELEVFNREREVSLELGWEHEFIRGKSVNLNADLSRIRFDNSDGELFISTLAAIVKYQLSSQWDLEFGVQYERFRDVFPPILPGVNDDDEFNDATADVLLGVRWGLRSRTSRKFAFDLDSLLFD